MRIRVLPGAASDAGIRLHERSQWRTGLTPRPECPRSVCPMQRLALLCAVFGFGLLTTEAHAEGNDDNWDGGYKVVATRRSGFMIGITTGLALGNAYGYPNELAKLNDPNYERNTKFGIGAADRLWFGGALTDWFVFGIGLDSVRLKHANADATGSAFIFHVEGYPLFYQGGPFRDLSLFGDFGAGGMKITGGTRAEADGGLMSVVGFGVGYEPVRFWRFTFGPAVEYMHTWSQSMNSNTTMAEARLTFVGGP
jgi:hypothetical protein